MDQADRDKVLIGGYRAGAIGRVAELHGVYYHRHWNFDLFFEAGVAKGISEFLTRLDPSRDRFWGAYTGDRLIGSIVIDGSESPAEGAHLRWFIVDPSGHGLGLGRKLLGEALDFCRKKEFERVYLWTFAGLDQARRLYEQVGFKPCRELENNQWGKVMTEQMMEWRG